MHDNSDVVDTAGFSVFFAQARQSRLGEVAWKPESCSRDQFCPGEKVFSPRRGYGRQGENDPCSLDQFRSSKNIFAQAKSQNKKKKLGFLF